MSYTAIERVGQPSSASDIPLTVDADKDPKNVARGLKASIANPNVSEDAKDNAARQLDQMGYERPGGQTSTATDDEHTNRVIGGYKATLHNDNTSDQAKAHAREILDAYDQSGSTEYGVDEHEKRQLAGYKAALSNPRVSEGAKQHARQFLEEHGAL